MTTSIHEKCCNDIRFMTGPCPASHYLSPSSIRVVSVSLCKADSSLNLILRRRLNGRPDLRLSHRHLHLHSVSPWLRLLCLDVCLPVGRGLLFATLNQGNTPNDAGDCESFFGDLRMRDWFIVVSLALFRFVQVVDVRCQERCKPNHTNDTDESGECHCVLPSKKDK